MVNSFVYPSCCLRQKQTKTDCCLCFLLLVAEDSCNKFKKTLNYHSYFNRISYILTSGKTVSPLEKFLEAWSIDDLHQNYTGYLFMKVNFPCACVSNLPTQSSIRMDGAKAF